MSQDAADDGWLGDGGDESQGPLVTAWAVCHNKRIARHKVFWEWATRGKYSMGWYYGFKLHLMVNDQGERLAFWVSPGEGDDRDPVEQMAQELWGHLYGDRGYISKVLHDALWAKGLKLITLIRRNMKPCLMRLWGQLILRQRFLIETINDQLKNVSQIEHSQHRSLRGFMVNLVGGLIAYTYQPKKLSLELWCGESGCLWWCSLSRTRVKLKIKVLQTSSRFYETLRTFSVHPNHLNSVRSQQ